MTIAVHNRVSNLPTVVGKAGEDVVDAKGELDNDLGLASLVLRLSTGLHTVPAGSASFTAKQASDAWSVLSDTITRIEDRSVLSVSVCLSVCLCACASVVRCPLSFCLCGHVCAFACESVRVSPERQVTSSWRSW